MASTLKFWNKQNSNNSNNAANQNGGTVVENGKTGSGGRNWLHQPDALTNGHVAYLVKYLGNTPVDQPKGIEVVKEAIRKLQFTQQIKKAENGSNYKTKKVEITVSIDGVAIQEPRTNNILHQFPLHKISYCADEKGAKKFFSFIAKTGNGPSSAFPNGEILSQSSSNSNGIQNGTTNGTTNGSTDEGHECFVFISNKLASDITLTIGQAFDLAYKRYVNDNGKTMEVSKLQSQNRQLENTVTAYRQRLKEFAEVVSKNDLERLLVRLGLRDILEVPQENGSDGNSSGVNGSKTPDLGIDVSTPSNDDQLLIETSPKHFAPIVPPRNMQNPLQSTLDALKPSVGTKLEGLLLNSDSDSDFDPRAEEPEIVQNGNGNKISNDLFGYEPPKQSPGQQLFTNNLLSNGFSNGVTTNGLSSPPPLLAPPPKASTPRRNTPGNNVSNASQDLFGSTPFSMQPTPVFDALPVTSDSLSFENSLESFPTEQNSALLDDLSTLTNISHQFNTILSHSPVFPGENLSHSVSNPFLHAEQQQQPTGISPLTSHSPSKYDAFKTLSDFNAPLISNQEPFAKVHENTDKKPSPDLFKDFAVSAFNQFKREPQQTKLF